jgi:SNARE domain
MTGTARPSPGLAAADKCLNRECDWWHDVLVQGTMLDELDEDVEGTSARLAAAQKRINHVLAKAGMKGQMCIILFLVLVLAVLIVIAFS